MASNSFREAAYILAAIGVAFISNGIFKLYTARVAFYQKVKAGYPMPKWNPIFGHLLLLKDIHKLKKLPVDISRPDMFRVLQEDFKESDSLYYVDLWPFIAPLLLVASPSYAIQTCQQYDLGKPEDVVGFLHPIAGGDSLFTLNGEEARHTRSIFSSGFNSNYVLNQTGHIVQEAEEYVKILRGHAQSGRIVQFDEVTLNYMMDVSGAMTLNTRLFCQRRKNPLAAALRHTLRWYYMGELKSPLVRWSPLMRFITWHNGRTMDQYITKILRQRFQAIKQDGSASEPKRSAIDLALADYMTGAGKDRTTLEPSFEKWAVTQLRLFFFVGHDSTAPTISYFWYLVSKNPEVLRKVREEHNAVFGTDLTTLPSLLREKPHLLNQLSYTTAVLKETLRLYPPAGGMRVGAPGVFLQDAAGNKYPTDGTRVWILHPSLHRNPKYWPQANQLIPERWLVGPEDPLYPIKGAWRPFEYGKRDCLGQSLAMLDLRVSIAMTVREFDVTEAYDEWDRQENITRWRWVQGERAYQIGDGGAHPADGFPCRVSLRKDHISA